MSEQLKTVDQSYHKDNDVRIWTHTGIQMEAAHLGIDCMERKQQTGATLFVFSKNGQGWTCSGVNEAVGFLKGFAMAKSLSRMHG